MHAHIKFDLPRIADFLFIEINKIRCTNIERAVGLQYF
jgi:hypothetical protein